MTYNDALHFVGIALGILLTKALSQGLKAAKRIRFWHGYRGQGLGAPLLLQTE